MLTKRGQRNPPASLLLLLNDYPFIVNAIVNDDSDNSDYSDNSDNSEISANR